MSSRTTIIFIIFILAFLVRLPMVGTGLPYFHDEDEAHHFNRNLRMLQSGDFDPHYFHKPSLHFYLRIPALTLGFFNEVREGRMKSIQDATTTDSFGIANYSFSASHPGLVKWARAVSLLASLLTVFVAFLIAESLFGLTVASMAGFLTAMAPALILNSSIVGVDSVMGLFVLLSTWFAISAITEDSKKFLTFSAIMAGLAISTKYNAAPAIIFVPVVGAFFICADRTLSAIGLVVIASLAFLLGSPFILKNFPLFLDQAGYEVWHYAVAGHEGHSAEPGLAQASFFTSWLGNDGFGWIPLAAALIGAFWTLFIHRNKVHLTFLTFPILYFLFMSGQKANFTRNLVPLIPYLGILAAYTAIRLTHLLPFKGRDAIAAVVAILTMLQPATGAVEAAVHAYKEEDSRVRVSEWIVANRDSLGKVAIDGTIQFDKWTKASEGFQVVDLSKTSLKELSKDGFNTLIAGQWNQQSGMNIIKDFDGHSEKLRILDSPRVLIVKIR